MSLTDIRKDTISIINEVQRKLGVNTQTSLTGTKLTTTLLDFLNDVIDEVSDFGDWQQMFREAAVTATSSVAAYKISVSADVKNIYEIVWGDDVSPLEVRSIEDIRRLQRLASFGTPRQFAVVGVSGTSPKFRIYPVPTSAAIAAETSAGGVFDVAYYKKPRLLTTSDTSAVPAFPSRVLVQGVYAKALLEENGGERNSQYDVAYAEYTRMRIEALNRFNADTGTDIYVVPTGSRYG
jgi:hypothetical protein